MSDVLTDLRRLRRSREGRVVAGVCAGVGRDLRVDPVILRLTLAVLSAYYGVGLLLYAAAWLLLPVDDGQSSTLSRQVGQRRDGGTDRPLVVGAGVVLLIVIASMPWWGVGWPGPALLVLAGLGFVALLRRPDATGEGTRPDAAAPDSIDPQTQPLRPTDDAVPSGTDQPMDIGSSSRPDGPETPVTVPAQMADVVPGGSWRDMPPQPAAFWNQPDPLGLEAPAPGTGPPARAPVREPRPMIRRASPPMIILVLGVAALAAVGTTSVVAGVGSEPSAQLPIAAALGVVGLGVLAGTWLGRSRLLIGVGSLLLLLLGPAVLSDSLPPGGFGEVSYSPREATDIRDEYRLSGGSLELDLSQVDFTDDTVVSTRVIQGVGDLTVLVPPNVDVEVEVDARFGDVRVFDQRFSGGTDGHPWSEEGPPIPPEPEEPLAEPDPSSAEPGSDVRRFVDNGVDGEGGGRLTLNLELNVGELEVSRG